MILSDEPLVLCFDIGTQSIRALVVNPHGEIILNSDIVYKNPTITPIKYGYAEQYPDFYYDKICECAKKLKDIDTENLFFRIKAVTVACIRDSVLILDKDYKPLRNIILWLDNRRAESYPKLNIFQKAIFSSVGMTQAINMLYKDSFFNWIKDNEPALWAKTDKFVFISSYINYKLTGKLIDSTANQVGHVPFDYKKRIWLKRGLSRCIADIPINKLVNLIETGKIIGEINKETSEKSGIPEGLPLIASGTDKACEALGLSVTTEDKAAISLGTASTIQFCTDHYFEPEPFLPSYPSIIPGYYNAEYQIYRGFWTITKFVKEFCKDNETVHDLDKHLEDINAGSDGLIITPHLSPGAGNPFAKGLIIGLNDHHTKEHIYRAIIEGINFELYHAMKRMEKRSGQKIKELYIAGGGSKCEAIDQITSDIFGLPVKKIQTHEATGIGSAISAFIGLGIYNSYTEATEKMIRVSKIFMPNMEVHKLYRKIYDSIYSKLERKNTPIFKKIKKIIQENDF